MSRKCLALTALTLMGLTGLNANSYETYYLDDYCSRSLSLPCSSKAYNRAGTLRFHSYRAGSCNVTVKIDTSHSSCSLWTNYGVYINFKIVSLGALDSLIVSRPSQSIFDRTPVVLKYLGSNTAPASYNPTSMAQLLMPAARGLVFFITLNRLGTGSRSANQVVLDYNVVTGSSSSFDSYCSALGKYVYSDLMCEHGDRVNCPSTYRTDIGFNPAYGTNQSNCCMATGSIAGTVVGSLACIVFFVVIITMIRRRRRLHFAHRHVTEVCVPDHHHHNPAPVCLMPAYQPSPMFQSPAPYLAGGTVVPEPPRRF